MASSAATLFDSGLIADRWIAEYCAASKGGDALCAGHGDRDAWAALFEELAALSGEDLEHARERAQRHAADIGTGFRIAGEGEDDERPWPLSPVPLLIPDAEWQGIEAGVAQRAELMELLLRDLYGEQSLVADGHVPAALVTGSPYFLRPLTRLDPPGDHHLHFVAFDLCRGPEGNWRVLADHLRAPAGAGYALENRLAMARTLDGLQTRLNIARHAPFFAAFREGLAASCQRVDPRMALLTPGRLNPSYPEQAHLARYLGLLLVEGE
ncbi:MAG: circularly permuted type 2 ATP-grasp protein, partial [Pseudomonadota bacterium]